MILEFLISFMIILTSSFFYGLYKHNKNTFAHLEKMEKEELE